MVIEKNFDSYVFDDEFYHVDQNILTRDADVSDCKPDDGTIFVCLFLFHFSTPKHLFLCSDDSEKITIGNQELATNQFNANDYIKNILASTPENDQNVKSLADPNQKQKKKKKKKKKCCGKSDDGGHFFLFQFQRFSYSNEYLFQIQAKEKIKSQTKSRRN